MKRRYTFIYAQVQPQEYHNDNILLRPKELLTRSCALYPSPPRRFEKTFRYIIYTYTTVYTRSCVRCTHTSIPLIAGRSVLDQKYGSTSPQLFQRFPNKYLHFIFIIDRIIYNVTKHRIKYLSIYIYIIWHVTMLILSVQCAVISCCHRFRYFIEENYV